MKNHIHYHITIFSPKPVPFGLVATNGKTLAEYSQPDARKPEQTKQLAGMTAGQVQT
ncbi:MAG: hypothetical protein LBH04_04280 [Tannerellaceae bacterium]|jgi:hypothetical protein|nr:hypothetical protein [Tannerellaceae bacterium]